jgi:hypothetical protein
MRNILLITTACLAFVHTPGVYGQEVVKPSLGFKSCYAGNKVNRIYVPPPKEFFLNNRMKGGATVTMLYSGFPPSAVKPMDYAASILASVLPSGTHITIKAYWQKLTISGVLAQSSTTGYVFGSSIDAFNPYAFYPVSLAEKISGKSLNRDADGDVSLFVNSSVNWYLGTDGRTSTLRYDLVTVAIHEIIHGLGFFDSMDITSGTGYYGINGVPLIYDTFVENLAGKKLTDTLSFTNPSVAIKTALTSGQLYFNGPLEKNYSGGRVRLYAPQTFETGSSVAHLDETTTPKIDALMTPAIDMGEAIHDPGKLTMSILGDLGWINTRISHEKPKDTEQHISSLIIAASLKSDTAYNHNKVGITWSFDNYATNHTSYLTSLQSDNNYSVSITVPSYESKLQYFLSVEDIFGRQIKLPSNISSPYYSVVIGTDTIKPVIRHSQVRSVFERARSIDLSAAVSDNLGVDSVYIEYIVNEGVTKRLRLSSKGSDEYNGVLYLNTLGVSGGDSMRYRIIGVDDAAVSNSRKSPAAGWYTVRIEKNNPVASGYSTDFSSSAADFLSDGITIGKPSGFTKYGLNTPHPYVSPEDTGDSLGYVATLRTPIKFDASGIMINFKEVVLVEPGETGTQYGQTDFYDYVVVEGSKDFGKSWFALGDGYDSRFYTPWLTAYNSMTTGQNSTYVPFDESLLIKHYFFPKTSSNISTGDTIMVRFRLFSDPFSNGWGWIIQDLKIEAMIDNAEELNLQPLILFPNPGDGHITIRNSTVNSGPARRYSVYSSSGTFLKSGILGGGNEASIDISGYKPGLYLIIVHNGSGARYFKYNLLR